MGKKNTFDKGLTLLEANIFSEVKKELLDIGDDLEGQGALNAPINLGFLRQSIKREADVKISKIKGQTQLKISVTAATDYAAIQHDNTSFIHPKGGRAKYLTGPAEERKDIYQRAIALAMRKGLKKSKQK